MSSLFKVGCGRLGLAAVLTAAITALVTIVAHATTTVLADGFGWGIVAPATNP
jgi:hypothetical protein